MGSKFNVRHSGFRFIIETPLIMNNIRSRIDEEIFEEYKRFKYKQPAVPDPDPEPMIEHVVVDKAEYEIKDEEEVKVKKYKKRWRVKKLDTEIKENAIARAESETPPSAVESSSSSLPPTINFNKLPSFIKGDKCQIHSMSAKSELNGVNGILQSFDVEKQKWSVMLSTGVKAGSIRTLSSINLLRSDDVPKIKKEIAIKSDATKIGLTNLNKSTSKSHVIYKLEKTFGVKVVYCSDIIDDPYCAKSNFIAKLELESCEQIGRLIQASQCQELYIEKQCVVLQPYTYKYKNYKQILGNVNDLLCNQQIFKKKRVSLSNLYKRYKDMAIEGKKLTLFQFCQLIEHKRTVFYLEKNMIRIVRDQNGSTNHDKIGKMVTAIFDENGHIVVNKWTIGQFKKKWAQRYNTMLDEKSFGKYRSFIHFLNDIQRKYELKLLTNRKRNESSIKFKISLR